MLKTGGNSARRGHHRSELLGQYTRARADRAYRVILLKYPTTSGLIRRDQSKVKGGRAAATATGGGNAMIFWTTLLIIHGLLALALLGAITHQAVALWWPVRVSAGSFIARFRAVPSTSYVTA